MINMERLGLRAGQLVELVLMERYEEIHLTFRYTVPSFCLKKFH